jgi:hypothetical protein
LTLNLERFYFKLTDSSDTEVLNA